MAQVIVPCPHCRKDYIGDSGMTNVNCRHCGFRFNLQNEIQNNNISVEAPRSAPVPNVTHGRNNGGNRFIVAGAEFVLNDVTLVRYAGQSNEVIVPEGVMYIGKCAFERNMYLEKVILPKGLKSIGERAFADCMHLKSVEFPVTLTQIQPEAFLDCIELEKIELPKYAECVRYDDGSGNISPFGSEASLPKTFKGCMALKEIVIDDSMKSVPPHIFDRCSSDVNIKWKNLSANIQCSDVTDRRMNDKRCLHCGGKFKGFFNKCSSCGTKRDYKV